MLQMLKTKDSLTAPYYKIIISTTDSQLTALQYLLVFLTWCYRVRDSDHTGRIVAVTLSNKHLHVKE